MYETHNLLFYLFQTRYRIIAGSIVTFTTLSLSSSLYASDALHSPVLPWSHKGNFQAFDTASIRRGLIVYQNVCAACHSLNYLHYRQLVGVTHTEEQAKALAAKADVVDGPNEKVWKCYNQIFAL